MNTITTIAAPHFQPLAPAGGLRLELQGELHEMRDVIAGWNPFDEANHLIASWKDRFVAALQRPINPEETCRAYIAQLQALPCSFFTRAVLERMNQPLTAWQEQFSAALHVPGDEVETRRIHIDLLQELFREPFTDRKTREITFWFERFEAAFRSTATTERVRNEYIALLQDILKDPIIPDAPLDQLATLGSDGETYGRMSLSVYRFSMAETDYEHRSPLEPENPAHFVEMPNPVVQHMLRWLDRHHALLHPEAIERNYREMLPEELPETNTAALDRIAAHHANFRRRNRELEPQNLDDRAFQAALADAGEERQRIALNDHEAIMRLQAQLANMANPLVSVEAQRAARAAEDQVTLNRMNGHIDAFIAEDLLQPLRQRIDAHAREVIQNIQRVADRENMNLEPLQARIRMLDADMEELDRQREELVRNQRELGTLILDVQRDDLALRQGIIETRKVIEDAKKNTWNKILKVTGTIAGCVFVTWAVPNVILTPGRVTVYAHF